MKAFLTLLLVILVNPALAMNDDPLLVYAALDRFELSEDEKLLESEVWVGTDNSRWVINLELEGDDTELHETAVDVFHRTPLSAFWDFEVGARHLDIDGNEGQWLRLGLSGLAPYFIETSLALYVRDGQTHLEGDLHHELPLAADWAVMSRLEFDIYSENEVRFEQGSGLGTAEFAIHLRYERHKNLFPYVGVVTHRNFGITKDISGDSGGTYFVVGLSAWF